MISNKTPIAIVVLFFFSQYFISAYDISTVRRSAIGGPHAALADDRDALFTNPAGYLTAEPEITITQLDLLLTGPVFTIANVFLSNKDSSGGLPDGAVETLTGLYAGMDLAGPLSFAYVGNGLGVGLFNKSGVTMKTSTDVDAAFEESTILVGGYSFNLPIKSDIHRVDAGFNLKGYVSGGVNLSESLVDVVDVISSMSSNYLSEQPFIFTTGMGSDLGFLYSYKSRLKVGMSVMDLITYENMKIYSSLDGFMKNAQTNELSTNNEFLPQRINLGVMYRPSFLKNNKYLSDWKLMADYSDMFDFLLQPKNGVNPILHLGIGSEVTLLDILSLRLGVYQALLNAGMGMNLQFLRLNLAIYGKELSTEPGVKSVYNLRLGMEFSY
ncbi:hypothetical protein [Spirochaeta cellobiosiphila]|uniref:hypothetical protein n=1 Tax=Spirochaeta cellobiosiphila TaxID=504483 RepID=UPI00146C6389|nr:hypothetical protein [Spirochaeta cellobiosiphila]